MASALWRFLSVTLLDFVEALVAKTFTSSFFFWTNHKLSDWYTQIIIIHPSLILLRSVHFSNWKGAQKIEQNFPASCQPDVDPLKLVPRTWLRQLWQQRGMPRNPQVRLADRRLYEMIFYSQAPGQGQRLDEMIVSVANDCDEIIVTVAKGCAALKLHHYGRWLCRCLPMHPTKSRTFASALRRRKCDWLHIRSFFIVVPAMVTFIRTIVSSGDTNPWALMLASLKGLCSVDVLGFLKTLAKTKFKARCMAATFHFYQNHGRKDGIW